MPIDKNQKLCYNISTVKNKRDLKVKTRHGK